MLLTSPTALPAWGSVKHIVPVHCPAYIFSRYIFFCSGVPKLSIKFAHPRVKPGYVVKEQQAATNISAVATATDSGSPWPPASISTDAAIHPPSQYFLKA